MLSQHWNWSINLSTLAAMCILPYFNQILIHITTTSILEHYYIGAFRLAGFYIKFNYNTFHVISIHVTQPAPDAKNTLCYQLSIYPAQYLYINISFKSYCVQQPFLLCIVRISQRPSLRLVSLQPFQQVILIILPRWGHAGAKDNMDRSKSPWLLHPKI